MPKGVHTLFYCLCCANPLAGLCQPIGTTLPTHWHNAASVLAVTIDKIRKLPLHKLYKGSLIIVRLTKREYHYLSYPEG